MKKFLNLLLGLSLIYSCSTNTDGNGNSNTTNIVPVAPTNLTGVAVSLSQINLSWTDNSTNETGFKIERKTGSGIYTAVGTTTIDVNTFIDTGLSPTTTYNYRVYSFNSTGNSAVYSNEIIITTPSITDIDGNAYELVTICNQTWIKSNLNVSHYRNGDIIPQVTDPTQWANLTTGAWCYYDNNSANGTVYGKLYNWYAVNDSRGLAPQGYHIPSTTELNTFFSNCLGGTNIAGGKIKETGTQHWITPNTSATNISGFTALPGGIRGYGNTSSFGKLGSSGQWWSSTEISSTDGQNWATSYDGSWAACQNSGIKTNGYSVRCIRD